MKQKLLYIVRYSIDEDFNLKMKFDGQLEAFRNIGYDVYFVGYDHQHFYLIHNDSKEIIGNTHFSIPSYIHTFYYVDVYNIIRKLIKKEYFDYFYWRSAPSWLASYRLTKAIKKSGSKLIYEIPTFLKTTEKPLSKLRALFEVYSSHWNNKMNQYIDCYVMIGEDAHGMYKGKPAINIDNGINVDAIPVRKVNYDPNAIHLMALASMSYWHGYDRIIQSLADYKGNQKVIIHMIGGNDGGSFPEWK